MDRQIARLAQRGSAGRLAGACAVAFALLAGSGPAVLAQDNVIASTERRSEALSEAELEALIGPVALYPDDLLAILLPAATYPLQIVQAARFLEALEEDPSLEPDPDWDDAVVALLNYPEVLSMLNEDLDWTWALGEAVLYQQAELIDSVQRFRERAYAAGNLQSDDKQTVSHEGGTIQIAPADPEVVYVPYYEPTRVVVVETRPVVRYYSRPYPVYYYPYPSNYTFVSGYFWGVTTAFSIGWNTHHVHIYPHTHIYHPYYSHVYYSPHYVRYGFVNVNINYIDDIWYPRYRSGPRPGYDVRAPQVTVSNEGYTRNRGSSSNTTMTVRERLAATRQQAEETTRSAVVRSTPGNANARYEQGQQGQSDAVNLPARTRVPTVENERTPDRSVRVVTEGVTRTDSSPSTVVTPMTVRERVDTLRQSAVVPSTRTRVETPPPAQVVPQSLPAARMPAPQPTPRTLVNDAANRAPPPAATAPTPRTRVQQARPSR